MISFLRKVQWWLRRSGREDELREELEFHLAEEVGERQAGGLPPHEAKWAAQRDLGNTSLLREEVRTLWSWRLFEQLAQDVRYALRSIRRSPAFAFAAILTLSVGIGAVTAMFAILYAVQLRELQVPDPRQLVFLEWESRGQRNAFFSYPHLEVVRSRTNTLSGVAFINRLGRVNVVADGTPGVAVGERVSGNYFTVLRIQPEIGRLLDAADERRDDAVAVISHSFWQRRFGGDPSVVGKAISVNGFPLTIVGVTPRDFGGVAVGTSIDVRVPLRLRDRKDGSVWLNPSATVLLTVARLQAQTSMAEAEAELAPILESALTAFPPDLPFDDREGRTPRMHVLAANRGLTEGRALAGYVPAIRMLIAIAGLMVVLACANVANLLFARVTVRRREMAVRLALGASQGRLMRQLLTESVVLGLLGGIGGLAIAVVGATALVRIVSTASQTITLDLSANLTVVGFATTISLIATALFGIAPAIHASRVGSAWNISSQLRHLSWLRWSRTVVAVQMAICILLLLAAGLFGRSVRAILARDAGFTRQNVLMFSVDPAMAGYRPEARPAVYSKILEALGTIQRVTTVSASLARPIDSEIYLISGISSVDGRQLTEQRIRVAVNIISPAYFSTLSVPLVGGRDFDQRDGADGPKVAIINETLARQLFGVPNVIGRRIGVDADSWEIVGVAQDTLYAGLTATVRGVLYLPLLAQRAASNQVTFLLRHSDSAGAVAEAARLRLRDVDATLPVYRVNTLEQEAEDSLVRQRLLARVSATFGLMALLIGGIGVYSAVSFAVTRRTNEIGVRIALGARRADVVRMALRDSLMPVAIGSAIGVPTGVALMRVANSLLFGITPADPVSIAGGMALLAGAATVASYLPARRAARVDPMVALRHE
jgi:predicted permease